MKHIIKEATVYGHFSDLTKNSQLTNRVTHENMAHPLSFSDAAIFREIFRL